MQQHFCSNCEDFKKHASFTLKELKKKSNNNNNDRNIWR